jgi:hypothetical protein
MGRGRRARDWRGEFVGRLLPLARVGTRARPGDPRKTSPLWLCVCARSRGGCGRLVVRLAETLAAGDVRSCGCWQRERAATLVRLYPRRRPPRAYARCANCNENCRGRICGLCRTAGVEESAA